MNKAINNIKCEGADNHTTWRVRVLQETVYMLEGFYQTPEIEKKIEDIKEKIEFLINNK